MQKTIVICDSSCDYSAEQASAAGFSIVPLSVSFGDETYIDGLELSPSQFFAKQATFSGLPKTSQPSPGQFMRVFQSYPDAQDIICVCVTGESSGTVRSAQTAAELLEGEGFAPRIHVIDTGSASIGLGLIADEAASMAKAKQPVEQILSRIAHLRETMALYFVLDTLEFVRRGGRIGNISAVVGQLLGVKPILTFLHGSPTDVDKCRGLPQAMRKLVQTFLAHAADTNIISIIHANAPARAKELANMLKEVLPALRVRIHCAGAIIGTYAGPGALGIAFEEKAVRQ